MIGKVPPDTLSAQVLTRTGAHDASVLMGPKYGEDAAAIDLGDEILVVSSDPISLAAERVGTLGVYVACNDVAVSGATPRWLTSVLFLPDADVPVEAITDQLDTAASNIDVAIVGGHSEYNPALDRPLLSLTAFGVTDRFIGSSGAGPGDRVILTKGAGIEGTAILASDFRDAIAVDAELVARAEQFFDEISVIEDARIAGEYATAMHDPTEGGVVDGLIELAYAAGVEVLVERSAVPVRAETQALCEAMGVDPLRIFGSGGLLACVPADHAETVVAELGAADIAAAEIGTVCETDEPQLVLDGEPYREPVRDDLYDLWA